MRVLLYVGDGLGNIVHTLPTIEGIRRAGHELVVSVISTWSDATYIVEHDDVRTGLQKHDGFDRVYGSATLKWLRVAGKPYLPPDVVFPPADLREASEVGANFWIARELGYKGEMPYTKPRHSDYKPEEERYVILAPGFQKGNSDWHNKAYPHWETVAQALVDKLMIDVVCIGSEEDSEPWMARHRNYCGKTTLPQLMGLLANAAVVVGVDNGPTAISAALDVPTAVLWGPTSPLKNMKRGRVVANLVAMSPLPDCQPCQFTSRLRECRDNRCMNFPPSEVANAVLATMGGKMVIPPRTANANADPPLAATWDTGDALCEYPVVVLGCGRSGTNMVLEALRASGQFNASEPPEDKGLMQRSNVPPGYLTKCDTWYFDWLELDGFLGRNPGVRVVWTVRDPRDMALSKMRRGVPLSEGGDCETLAGDATLTGCVADIRKMYRIYRKLMASEHAHRVVAVEMEDVILDFERTMRALCLFCGVEWREGMHDFWKYVRTPEKRERYNGLDKSQVALWKHWSDVYDGFFADRDPTPVFDALLDIVRDWQYPEDDDTPPPVDYTSLTKPLCFESRPAVPDPLFGGPTVDWYDESWRRTLAPHKDSPYLKQDTGDPKVYWNRNRACLAALGLNPELRILDAGCGSGYNTLLLAREFNCLRVTGCDFSPVAIEHCRSQYPWAKFDVCDVSTLCYPDASFDRALVIDLTEHLPEAVYREFLRELKRVLVPRGRAVVLPGIAEQPQHVRAVGAQQTASEFADAGFALVQASAEGGWFVVEKPAGRGE